MIKIDINNEMIESAKSKARDLGKLNNSITKAKGNLAGFLGEEGEKVTHIIEYSNIFNQAPTWKLCRNEEEYKIAMETGAFINPFLLWTSIRPSITGERNDLCYVCEKPFGKWKYGDRAFCNVHIIPLQLGLLI